MLLSFLLLPLLAFLIATCRHDSPFEVQAFTGVDVSTLLLPAAWQCLVGQNYTFAIVRCFQSTGNPDPNAPQTIQNAWDGQVKHVDVYMFPCGTCAASAATQVQAAISSVAGSKYTRFWFDIEQANLWNSDVTTNQQWLTEGLQEAVSLGAKPGIYSSASQWQPIMGDFTGASKWPLWYAHYDANPSFSDFTPFGGWTKPAMKQFGGNANVCGANVDLNFQNYD